MDSLVEARLRRRLGYPIKLLTVGLHAHRQNKILLFGFRTGRQVPDIVCRLSRTPEGSDLLRQEALTRYVAYERLEPAERGALPWLVVEELPSGTCLIEPFVTGSPVAVPERPSDLEAWGRMSLGWVGALRRATLNRIAAPEVLCTQAMGTLDRVSRGFAEPEIRALAERLRPELGLLAGLHPATVHGDYWHGNLKLEGGNLKVLDWEYAQIQGNPLFDPLLNLVALSGALPGRPVDRFEECFLHDTAYSRQMGRVLLAHAGDAGPPKAMALTLVLVTLELVLRNLSVAADIRRDRHYPLLERLSREPDPLTTLALALWPNG